MQKLAEMEMQNPREQEELRKNLRWIRQETQEILARQRMLERLGPGSPEHRRWPGWLCREMAGPLEKLADFLERPESIGKAELDENTRPWLTGREKRAWGPP